MASAPLTRLTEEEYLALERAAETRSEFLNGEMFAMSGASTAHSRLQGDLLIAVGTRLRNGPCEPLTSDHRVKVEATGLYAYPDLSVVCGEPRYAAKDIKDTLINPVALFEVLSPSTANFDRGLKFFHYRKIPTLRDFVLVSQDELLVEHHTRGEDNSWTLREFRDRTHELRIDSIGVSILLDEIYRRVQFDAAVSAS